MDCGTLSVCFLFGLFVLGMAIILKEQLEGASSPKADYEAPGHLSSAGANQQPGAI
jgi:hypothetical protein